jgi:hypothetical protein
MFALMSFETPIRSLPEAKRFFLSEGCSSFHMSRDCPDLYDQYRAVGVSKATETQWVAEDLQSKISQLESGESNKDELWAIHSSIAGLVLEWKFEAYLDRVLEVTNAIEPRLAQRDGLLVSETIVGRQNLEYRPGLIFRSHDTGRFTTASGFAGAVRRLVAVPFKAADLEQRRQRLLDSLAQTLSVCGI